MELEFLSIATGNAKGFFAAILEDSVLLLLDFPGGLVVKNLHANVAGTGSTFGLARIPHATEHLSPCTTTEPVCCNYWSLQA